MSKRLCTICARGGSKGVANKNTRLLLGLPLVAHSIRQAKESGMFHYIAVSSDDPKILEMSSQYGADFVVRRPEELATDRAAKLPVIQHCALEAEKAAEMVFDTYTDLDATSPLRSVEDIRASIQTFESDDRATNLITGSPARRSPYFNLAELSESGYAVLSKTLSESIVRRQDAPKSYDMNASIYIWNRESLFSGKSVFQERTLLYEMPEERSVDIDSELDFEIVEFLAKKRGELL